MDPMLAIKEKIGTTAAALVERNMIIGLGTGSTARCFIQALALRFRDEKLNTIHVSSSNESAALAKELGLPIVTPDDISSIDITFDGADEIDPEKRMIKGAGGALLKEKIVATASKELIIMVDETKCVKKLGKAKLPVEVAQFGHHWTAALLRTHASSCQLRLDKSGKPFITDNQHYIYDLELGSSMEAPETVEKRLRQIPGVMETGFFFGLAGRVIIGQLDGNVEIIF
jgi:ribose 5-phosphate isomerase A